MKKRLFIYAALLSPTLLWGEEKPSLVVRMTNGTRQEIAIDQIRSIRFAEESMQVSETDGSQLRLPIEQIGSLSFSSIALALETLSSDNGSETVTLTDLSGRIVYRGCPDQKSIPDELQGTFILTVGGKSQRIVISH